ncbi:MAG: class II fructose-bisphosphatase [Alphaproteobacteria bacterium]|nr:class II fructose-bisphosphatase [Alphaproteobacteria bacterium]
MTEDRKESKFIKSESLRNKEVLDSNIVIEAVRVTEAASISASHLIGKGDEMAADQVAVDAMRRALGKMNIEGTVVIGEGERDKAPMLYVGEKVGTGHGPKVDIALDPLEGTTICATAGANSLSVIAMTQDGGLLNAPDVYMEKIAIGLPVKEQIIDLDNSPKQNLQNLAKVKGCDIDDLLVVILERDRHEALIAHVRETGARVRLINDGDVAAVIGTALDNRADMYIGIGGAPEGVLAAAALTTTGGQMMGRLLFETQEQKDRAKILGITDFNKKYTVEDMAKGDDVMFAATGVTDGNMLSGVKFKNGRLQTNSIAMSSKYKTIRYIKTLHSIG